ncbi:MAG: bifunctional oligoribonuclease/PAP phosphatase NrnA [Porphyromonas sp.]|nr:bifunctional oligoribonuclease/PAP phosphatase NrnA [Porphyromonas sp.]
MQHDSAVSLSLSHSLGRPAWPFEADRYEQLSRFLHSASDICLLGHVNPDGDAVGSVTGFCSALRSAFPGKNIRMVVPNEIPRIVAELPLADEIISYRLPNGSLDKRAEDAILQANLICCLDFQSPKRLGPFLSPFLIQAQAPKVLIDHHLDPMPDFFALSLSYPPLSSTAELVYHTLIGMGMQAHVTADVAQSLLCGIITDTGCFAYQTKETSVFHVAADLIERGADKEQLMDRIYHRNTVGQIKLRGYVLSEKLHIYPEIGAAYFSLSKEEMSRFGVIDSETEGLVNEALSIDGINYSFYIRRRNSELKISLRSTGAHSVNDVASKLFNGGGHTNAAGAEYPDPNGVEEVARMILDEIRNRENK